MEAEFFSYRLEVVGAEIEHETPKKLVTRSDMDITECRMLLRQLDSVTKKAFNKTVSKFGHSILFQPLFPGGHV